MNIALAQINTTIGDFAGNTARILEHYRRACAQKADLVLFPELAICGYPPRDLLLKPAFVQDNLAALENLAKEIKGPPVVIGYVDRNSGPGRPLRNSAAVIQNGNITHRIHKTLLPTYDVFDEDRYFEPAETNPVISLLGEKIGITICEDIWNDEDFWPSRIYRRDPVKELKAQGMTLLLNISASPWHLKKEQTRYRMLETIARNDGIAIAYCNAVGGNDELLFDGQSMAFDKTGKLTALGKSFEEDLLFTPFTPSIAFQEKSDAELLFRALGLGLRDYVHKCGFRSVVLGLSGGIDSALTACIAVAALGKENVFGVAMPSKFSSQGSIDDAQKLAHNLGIRFEIIPIQPQVDAFRTSLSSVFAGKAEDTTEENIQSRVRGLTLMAISNKFGSLLITTGNKSELATGYCTLYGDMCGGLAVISDLSKMQVYDVSRWINGNPTSTCLASEVIPADSIEKPPSAELRPNQKDQDTLPPYPLLDQLLTAYVEQQQPAQEIARNGLDSKLVQEWTRRIDSNEYKRRQAAPGLRVTSKAFGVGRRMPIAQRYRETIL